MITLNENHFVFNITLETHVIKLAADTEEVMFDWIKIINSKLVSMNILNPSENLYSKDPFSLDQIVQPNDQTFEPGPSSQINEYEPIFGNLQRLSLNSSQVFPPPEEGPPPYELISNHSETISRPSSFRETQVEKLKKEIQIISGFHLKVCLLLLF